jgi:threonyl-tRNA synthetase
MVIPVGMGFMDYALELQKIFKKEKMYADVDTTGNTLPKKIRNAQLAQYNFIFGEFNRILRLVTSFGSASSGVF